MTKHVDAKLLGEHVRSMGCEFTAGRAELAPQIVQEVEEEVDNIEDVERPSGLMTASASQQPAAQEIHCASETEVCLHRGSLVHRFLSESCRGGGEAGETSRNRQGQSNYVDRDCRRRVQTDEHLRGHPYFSSFTLPVGRSQSRGGACFCALCPRRLSVFANTHVDHLCTCDVHQFIVFP